MTLRRLVLDLLMPHEPGIVTYALRIESLDGVDGVTVDVLEEDVDTKTVEVTIEGEDLSLEAVVSIVKELGGALHSVDQASAGSRITEPQASQHQRR